MPQDYYAEWKKKYGTTPQAPEVPEVPEQEDYYSKWKQKYEQVPIEAPPERTTWQKEFLPAFRETLKESISKNIKFIDIPKLREGVKKVEEPKPSKVGLKEVLAEVPGVLRERPVGKLFEEGYWKDVPTKLLEGAKEFVTEMFYAFIPMSGPERKRFASYMPQVEEPTPKEVLKAGVAPPVGMITFLPRAAIEFAADPSKMIQEKPFELAMLLTAIGTPAARRLRTKIKQGKVTRADIQNVIETAPDSLISKETKIKIVEDIKPKVLTEAQKRRKMMEERGLIVAEKPKPVVEEPLPTGKALEAEVQRFKEIGGKVERLEYAPEREVPLVQAIEETADILGIKKPERGKIAPSEYYSGYPFIKEIRESMTRLKKGELGGITEAIPPEPPAAKPQIVTKELPRMKIEPYSIPTTEPLRVVKRIKKGAMPVYRHELDALIKIKDLRPMKLKRFYENPLRVIEDYPIIKKIMYDPIKIAEDAIVRDFGIVEKNAGKMKRLAKKNPKRLGAYSTSKQPNGTEILRRMGKKVEKLTPQELQNYKTVRGELETMYFTINKARKLAGNEPMPKVKNYFTFARNLETLKQLGHDPIFERDMGILRKHLNAPPFKHALKRKDVLAPIELDFYEVYKNYMHSALRYIHKAPAIAKGRTMIGDYAFDIGGKKTNWSFKLENPRLHTYLTQWLDRQAGQTPPSIAPQFLRTAVSKLNRNIGTAVLTYNVRSALIQPTALRGAYIELGSKFLTQGIIDNLKPEMRKFARENIAGIRSRKMDIHVEEMLANAIRKKFGKARRKVAQIGITPLQFLDMEAARITALGAYRRALAPVKKGGLGLSQKEAKVYATDTVTRTQASAQPSDIAPIQATAIGKLGTIFQTFVINEWNFLSKDVMGWKNPKMTNAQRAGKVARLVASTALINALFEGIFKLRSPYPAPEWAIKHGLERGKDAGEIAGLVAREFGEQLPLVGGTIRWTTPYKTAWPASLQVAEGVIKLVDKIASKKTKMTRRDAETVGRLLGIPGTSQAAKYLSRRKRGMSHLESLVGIRTDIPKEGKGYTER